MMRDRDDKNTTRLQSQTRGERGRVHELTEAAMFAAVMCLVAPISIPIGIVPISLSLFALSLMAWFLPLRLSLSAVAVYLALGAVGLPIFSGFRGGIHVILGPTGGYLMAYPLMVLCIGLAKTHIRRFWSGVGIGSVVALVLCYTVGTGWYMWVTNTASLGAALSVCVYPFVLLDILKLFLGAFLAKLIQGHRKIGR